jgi:hypothetical protein
MRQPRHVNSKRNEKTNKRQGHGQQEQVEPLVIVQSHRVPNKGTKVIKHQNAFPRDTTVFGP